MNKEYKSNGGLKLLDAVEALSKIADTPWEIETSQEETDSIDFKDPHWLQRRNKKEVAENIKTIFGIILDHLKSCYQEQNTLLGHPADGNPADIEGIKTIMVLVGEAAKKIDRYTDLFHSKKIHSVTETKEYRELQEFYNKKIFKTINEALLSKWVLELSSKAFKGHENPYGKGKTLDTKHVFVDLDSVKRDTDYELFFIRKGDGTRFFNPRLIRNIKLICDFGFQLNKETNRDPLQDLPIWQDRYGRVIANEILSKVKPLLINDYPLIIHHKNQSFFASLHKALLALYLASRRTSLLTSVPRKGCLSYLSDFQLYLREVLSNRNYEQMIAFPNLEFSKEELASKKIIEALLEGIFEAKLNDDRLSSYLLSLVRESNELLSQEHKKAIYLDKPFWSRLAGDFVAMQKFVRYHMNGPLNKILTYLEEGDYHKFDPYLQMRFPEVSYTLHYEGMNRNVHLLATPTTQEVINQAPLIPEWLGYLHSKIDKEESILLINFQDNTSWREFARAHAIENLQEASEFNQFLTVVTLAKDTEFYHQEMPYQEDHQLIIFRKHLIEQILGSHTGFYLPETLKKQITKEWIEGIFTSINRIFFSGKNVLSKEARLDFIEIFFLFFELKILEMTKAKELFFICKDGIDISPTAACSLVYLIKILRGEGFSEEETDEMTVMLYKPALISRERTLLPDRANRMLSAIKVMENAFNDYDKEGFKLLIQQAFSAYYKYDIRDYKVGFNYIS